MSQKSQSILTQGRCWLIVVCILWLCGCASPRLTTEWIGHPSVQVDHPQYQNVNWTAHLPNVDIGLRSDGVVVWRESK
jgi:hypothetical protein